MVNDHFHQRLLNQYSNAMEEGEIELGNKWLHLELQLKETVRRPEKQGQADDIIEISLCDLYGKYLSSLSAYKIIFRRQTNFKNSTI